MAANPSNIDLHRLLGVSRNADEKTILKAFRQLSRLYHPDKVFGQEEMMKLLTMAKVTLLDPDKRAKYEANYDMNDDTNDNQSDLSADLLRLTIGHRLSDDYRAKMQQWKMEYQIARIINNMEVFREVFREFERTLFNERTVFDLGGDRLINQGESDEKMLSELLALFAAQDFAGLAQYILSHQCRSVLTQLYEDIKPADGCKLPDKITAFLQIIKASGTLHANHNQNRIKDLFEAVYIYPTDECIDCVLQLVNNRMSDAHKDEVIDMMKNRDLIDEKAENKRYMHKLNLNPSLRSILKYENGIHNQNIEPMERAMLYIDLCMVYGHPLVSANSLMLASKELVALMLETIDTAEVYALKKCVIDLCCTVLYLVSTYANPMAQLKYSIHVIRLVKRANQILACKIDSTDSTEGGNFHLEKQPLIGELDKGLLALANHCVAKSIGVIPLIDTAIDMTSDVLYIDLINNRVLERYYQWNIDTYSNHPSAHLYQYSLMEGAWKSWFDNTKFDEYRRKCIEVLLGKTMTSDLDVAKIMRSEILVERERKRTLYEVIGSIFNSRTNGACVIEKKPMINRCEGGWLVPGENILNMGKMSFNSVDGVIIDTKNGTFKILVSTDEQIGPLCDGQDIDEIVIKGLSFGVFSLDQADFKLDYHPFQLMRFSPKSLDDSRYLSTLLAADYLLKMIATNTEVSAQPPFEIKEAVDGFLKSLPADLREFIIMKKSASNFGKVHRFWIESGETPCYRSAGDDGKLTYEFYYTPMMIKKRLLKKNPQGEFVDDFDDSEDELTDDSADESDEEIESDDEPNEPSKKISDEARFARRLTQFYDLIGCHFPVLLRLRELAKLSAISMILKSNYNTLEEAKKQLTVTQSEVEDILGNIRRQITFPICTESKVNEIYQETLLENGLFDDSRVAWSEINRVKNKIRNNLESAEEKLLINLTKQMAEGLELINTQALLGYVRDWLKNGHRDALIDYLRTAIYQTKMEKLSRFGNNLKQLGINLAVDSNTKLDECDSGCKWVPSTFSQLDGKRVYGGVCLQPKVSLQNDRGFKGFQASAKSASSSAGTSRGAFSGSSGSSSGPRNGGGGGGGSGSGSGSGNNGGGKGKNGRGKNENGRGSSGSTPKLQKQNIYEKYGHGKGWPDQPRRVGDYNWFAKPGTSFKTDQGIIVTAGPSGFVKNHSPRFSTDKAAVEAAARKSRGKDNRKVKKHEPDDETKYKHVHSTDKNGDKLRDGVHYLRPRK